MKKNAKIISFGIVIAVVVIGMVIFMTGSAESFNELVLTNIDKSNISSIEVSRSSDNHERITEDKETINGIIKDLESLQIKKSENIKESNGEVYWIKIKIDSEQKIGIVLSENHVSIQDGSKNATDTYKVTDGYNVNTIEGLFK
ncbi:MAG: hypothetical protein RR620_00850 [Clostridium sp.]